MSTPRRRKRRHSTATFPSVGYTNREGQSGLDPMDSYREGGYLQGIIIKEIFTGNVRTHNGFFLFIMLGLGILSTVTGVYAYIGTAEQSIGMALLCMIPMVVFGLALLYNFGINCLSIFRRTALGKWWIKRQNKPKYRKSKVSK